MLFNSLRMLPGEMGCGTVMVLCAPVAEPMSRDRLGFVFMALGGVAVLYAILSQLRFG